MAEAVSFASRIGAIEQDSRNPLYQQLQQLLRKAITGGVLGENDAIPAERELAEEFDISRITVRKAIGGLVEEGLLTRRRGAGTFIASRVEKSFSKISSFSEDMMLRGRSPSSQWISRTEGAVTPEESLSLGLSPGSKVYRFYRIRFADAAPMALEMSTIAGFGLNGTEEVETSLYEALGRVGNRPTRALQRLRAVPFDGEQARLLEVDDGHAGLLIERRGFLKDGRAIEFTQSYYRGDAYDFVAEIKDC